MLTGNWLKIIGAIAMTLDHIGVMLYPQNDVLRIIGRIAMPIFAYMIAEGCGHTKNKFRYFITMFLVAAFCQGVYYFTQNSLEQCILVTFCLSILLIYTYDIVAKSKNIFATVLFLICAVFCFYVCEYLPHSIKGFSIDYGFLGVLLPLLVYAGKNRTDKLMLSIVGMLILAWHIGGNQLYSLLSLPFLMLYNGKRGKKKMKYFFYIYYPLHLAVIHLISYIV